MTRTRRAQGWGFISSARRIFGGHQLGNTRAELTLTIGLAALLFLGAGIGMAYASGFDAVWNVLQRPRWPWLVACVVAEVVSLAGYTVGYRGISNVEKGPDLHGRPLLAVVVAGFTGLLSSGGGALDRYAMKAMGAGDREATARVAALTGLEHGSLPWIVCPTAIVQRTAPLGGGGLLMTALVPTLWYVGGVPLAVATVGAFTHRFFSLWTFMPVSLAELPTLRALGSRQPGAPDHRTSEPHGEPALQN